jgi:hypothetical protein
MLLHPRNRTKKPGRGTSAKGQQTTLQALSDMSTPMEMS